MARAGSLVFGSGHVVLPLVQAGTVTPGWVSGDAFLAGYGMAQAMPRPFFSLAAGLADHEIDLPMTVTPLGAVARLEHAPEDFEGERYRQRLDDSRRRLASYQSRGEGDFA